MERIFKTYKFFAYLFSYPEDENFFKKLEEFYPFGDKTPLEELKRIPLEELQAEYTSLFIANFKGVPCKPYQSFFGAEKTLMGAPAVETAKFYEIFGIKAPENDFPDRANFQLDFAAFLIRLISELKDPSERRKVEALLKAFFKKHILWMENLANCVGENTQIEPLGVLAKLFKNFLREEKKRLKL